MESANRQLNIDEQRLIITGLEEVIKMNEYKFDQMGEELYEMRLRFDSALELVRSLKEQVYYNSIGSRELAYRLEGIERILSGE